MIRRLLDRTVTRSGVPPLPMDAYGDSFGGWSTSGEHIDEHRACRMAAVIASKRVLASALVSMPPVASRGQAALTLPVVDRPAATVSRRAWVAQVAASLILSGNVYGLVTSWSGAGDPLSVETLPFGAVKWSKDPGGVMRPWVNGAEHKLFPVGDLVHQPATAFMMPGSPVALSPVELAMEPIGTSMSAEKFLAKFFSEGAHPSIIVKASRKLTGKEARKVKASVIGAMRGNRSPAVLGNGYEVETLDVNVKDAEMVAILRFQAENVARIFGVPPSMIYASISGQAVTYQNVGEDDFKFLKHSLRSWMDDIEDLWTELTPSGVTVELDSSALLKLDPKSRHDLYGQRLVSETMTVAEVRESEGEDPLPVADPPPIKEEATT